MEVSGTCEVPAPCADVWAALNDPDILRQCIPGCETMAVLPNGDWDVVALTKVGPIKARFNGRLSFSDIDPPNGYVITGTGNGGVAGFAKGRAEVHPEDAGPGTRLSYSAQSKIGGRIAQIGSRLLESTARKLTDQFFARFTDTLTGGETQVAADDEAPAVPVVTVTSAARLGQAPATVAEPSLPEAAGVPRLQLILSVAILFGVAACLFGIGTCVALILLLLHVGP